MNKVLPYLFWIICGALLLVEIILMLALSPSAPDGKSPEDTIAAVNTQDKSFQVLVTQAKHGPPPGPTYDPLDGDQMKKLISDYLDTPFWKKPLDDELDLYGQQMTSICSYLVERSKPLHEPISASADDTWYLDYENATAELLKSLYENKCLLMPPKRPTGMAGGPPGIQIPGGASGPPGGGAGHQAAPAAGPSSGSDSKADADAEPDFAHNKEIRKVAGFMTRGSDFPEAEPHGGINTLQYRIMHEIADILESSKATNDVSAVDPKRPPYEEHAKLVSTTFSNEDPKVVSIVLQGPLSSLLAIEAALEENRDDTQPIRVVPNGSLEQKKYTNEERLHVSSEPVILKITVDVLDFDSLKNEKVDFHPASAPPPKPVSKPVSKPAASAPAPKADDSQ